MTTTLTATTANITTANVTTLNTTGTSSFNTTNITTSNGLTSSGSVTINDNGGSTTRTLAVIPNSNSGSFNPTVQSGDISIVGMGTANGENGNFNISSWSNTRNGCRITNNSTTVSGGDNNIHVNSTNGVTIQSTKTQIKGKLISRNITAGYMVNGNVDIGTEFYPIICSTRKFRPANVDDYYIVNPGYKFTIYRNDDYTESAGVEYIYNVANTTDEVQIYTIPFIGKFNYDLKNRMNSIKVEYSDDGGANYTEVTLPGIS
jgi:hypothetical protein